MASLYSIQADLLDLFDVIEENGGEITEEQEKILCIHQENLREKLEDYKNLITLKKSEIECIKGEEKRLKALRGSKEKLVERLSDAVCTALRQFGDMTPKGTKFIEFPTFKLSIRESKTVEVDETRRSIFHDYLMKYINETVSYGVFDDENIDYEGIVGAINHIAQAERGSDFEPFTVADIDCYRMSISLRGGLQDLFKHHSATMRDCTVNPIAVEYNVDTTKSEYKSNIELTTELGVDDNTISHIVVKDNLSIK